MDDAMVERLEKSFALLAPRGEEVVARFYAQLFSEHPALRTFFPQLDSVRLTDFKVRALDARSGTAAKVRVLIESSDGEKDWGTVGVSEDIIEASWEALVESIEYKLLKDKQSK